MKPTPAEAAIAQDITAARLAATPALARRMASFVYEAMILFGLGLVPGTIGALSVRLLGAEDAQAAEGTLRAIAFVFYGIYFVWFWSNSGQTLPMRTWHLRLVTRDGRPLTQRRALARYLLACAWMLPGWLAGMLAGWRGWPVLAAVGVNIVAWAALALARRDRQFWHDAACGTRLVVWQPPQRTPRRPQPLAAAPR
jgi:uncharacterized RDD family membrane protein YckC